MRWGDASGAQGKGESPGRDGSHLAGVLWMVPSLLQASSLGQIQNLGRSSSPWTHWPFPSLPAPVRATGLPARHCPQLAPLSPGLLHNPTPLGVRPELEGPSAASRTPTQPGHPPVRLKGAQHPLVRGFSLSAQLVVPWKTLCSHGDPCDQSRPLSRMDYLSYKEHSGQTRVKS